MALTRVLSEWRTALQALGDTAVIPDGADERTIAGAEQRLGMQLPSSYRAFLATHNGWPAPDESTGPLLPVERITVMSDPEIESLAMLMDQRTALSPELMAKWITSHRGRLVQIAEYKDGYLLLDTSKPTPKGECDVCFVAAWIPGTHRYRSFDVYMKRQWEAFQAAHPVLADGASTARKRLNLRRPPDIEEAIRDPEQFILELIRLGYFQYANETSREDAISEYRKRIAQRLPLGALRAGRLQSSTVPLLDPSIHRCVWLDQTVSVQGRAGYVLGKLRDLLAETGTDLPPVQEELTETSYAASLGTIRHVFFKMRKGMPAHGGGSHPSNAIRYYAYESAKLATKFLKSVGSNHRIAVAELISESPEAGLDVGLVCLTDELSYLFDWAEVPGQDRLPLRPDVWG